MNRTEIKKYHIVYSIDLSKGVRVIDLYDYCIARAIYTLKDKVASFYDIPTKQVEIITAKQIKI